MKYLKIILLVSLCLTNLFAHDNCMGRWSDLIRIEIITGLSAFGTHSLKLSEEGLLCRTTSMSGNVEIIFCTFDKIDKKCFSKLQCFLLRNDYFSRDTIIDSPNVCVYDVGTTKVLIRKDWNKITKIEFIDNESNCDIKLDSLINLTNDLIPDRYKKLYAIKSGMSCKK